MSDQTATTGGANGAETSVLEQPLPAPETIYEDQVAKLYGRVLKGLENYDGKSLRVYICGERKDVIAAVIAKINKSDRWTARVKLTMGYMLPERSLVVTEK